MQQDIRGVLHAHTDLSDGVNTLEEMAEAVRQRGYEYFGVADHSQSVHYAGGLSLEEIGIQHAAIDRLNRKYGSSFRNFKGVESDILPDGSLDYTRTNPGPLRLRHCQRTWPVSEGPQEADGADSQSNFASAHAARSPSIPKASAFPKSRARYAWAAMFRSGIRTARL